ncbi:MAG: hypothetical protein P4L10_09730 [Acidobacteriaceae bacterium]|nr:hypothetical protein [Acidobacteriaceae bacterium]
MKIKNDFDEVGKAITEKQKMYIENARKNAASGGAKGKRAVSSGAGVAYAVPHNPPISSEKRADVESEPSAGDWKEFDEANIEGDIIRQRQADINEIEQLMNEVHSMTNDMAQEVANADAKLDQIGQNARSTKENTRKAVVDIAKGAEYQGKSYKKM